MPINYASFIISSTLKGICRKLGDRLRRALPVFPAMLRSMVSFLLLSPEHIAQRAAILCSFRALLRKCQITFSDSVLLRKEFTFLYWGMLITLRHSKKFNFKRRACKYQLLNALILHYVQSTGLKNHFKQVPAPPDSPAFLIPNGREYQTYQIDYKTYRSLDYKTYQSMLKYFG